MKILITGSLGLVGSEAVRYYLNDAWEVVGIDNDMRKHFFGEEASVLKNRIDDRNYTHHGIDISKIEPIIERSYTYESSTDPYGGGRDVLVEAHRR